MIRVIVFLTGIHLGSAAEAQTVADVAPLGICFSSEPEHRDKERLVVYGERGTPRVVAARLIELPGVDLRPEDGYRLRASGHYTSNALRKNWLVAYRSGGSIPRYELSDPEVGSWISSRLTLTFYTRAGEVEAQEQVECYDHGLAPDGATLRLTGSGRAEWGEEDQAAAAADADAARQCHELLTPRAVVTRTSDYRRHYSWAFTHATATYSCRQ